MGVWALRTPEMETHSLVSSIIFPSGVEIVVEIADTHEERLQGLSGRAELADQTGLLFLHDSSEVQRYWMKEMHFPIDLIWVQEGVVIGFVEGAQPENPPVTIYASPAPVDSVLEVSAGFIVENNVNVGDILDIRVMNQ